MNKFKKKISAFTLAEVLITLAIIGVVAAMTIPVLINIIDDMHYKTAYKRAYSMLSEALKSANTDNSLVEFPSAIPPGRPTPGDQNFLTIMAKFKAAKECTSGTDNRDCWVDAERYNISFPSIECYAFVDASGMSWSQYYWGTNVIFVDTNGMKKPNQWGKDRFVFFLKDSKNHYDPPMGVPIKVSPIADNTFVCSDPANKCTTENNYYGTSWLYK